MIASIASFLLLSGLALAEEPAVEAEAPEVPSPVAASRLPILADQMRESDVSESELRALLETALGSGVSLGALVGALEVVAAQLEAGVVMPDLALRLPGLITQGMEGEALAASLQGASQAATASVAVGVSMPAPEQERAEQPQESVSGE